jgi:hypothetical protein
MRKTFERTGTIAPDDPDWLAPINAAHAAIFAEIEATVRADRSWKVAEPLSLTVPEGETTWRLHCTLDTETGDEPILPGDPVPCGEKGCTERVERTFANRCQGCGYHFCDRHRSYGTCADGEPRTLCLDCRGPSDPWGPLA